MELKTLKDLQKDYEWKLDTYNALKQEAIKHIKAIQSGSGVDRTKFPETMKGSIVKKLWDNSDKFGIGIEYGFIIGLMTYINITEEDLKWLKK